MAPHARRRAFTLVELLIVLGIIIALAGLLLPMIGRAREAGKRGVCLNNVRQLTTAWLAYAADNDRHFCASSPGPLGWLNALNPLGPIKTGKLWPYLNDATPYRCPDDISSSTINPSSYAVNGLLAGPVGIPFPLSKLDDITNASKTFVFIEQAGLPGPERIPNVFSPPIYPANSFTSQLGHNHKGFKADASGTPISFADGHAIFWFYADPRTAAGGPAPNSPDVVQLEAWSGGPAPPDIP